MTFQQLYDKIKSFPDCMVQTEFIIHGSIHISADSALKYVNDLINDGKDPKQDNNAYLKKIELQLIIDEVNAKRTFKTKYFNKS